MNKKTNRAVNNIIISSFITNSNFVVDFKQTRKINPYPIGAISIIIFPTILARNADPMNATDDIIELIIIFGTFWKLIIITIHFCFSQFRNRKD